jgi:hypothetical protein
MGAVVLLLMIPVAAYAAGGRFNDDDDSIFESNIEWLASAGVTLGCNPPTNDNFCPGDNVTRGQMAAFMQRFAQYLGAEDGKVASADEADHAASADEADHATSADQATAADTAGDADMIGGVPLEGLVQHGEITMRHSTSDLIPNWLGGPSTITAFAGGNSVTGDGIVNIALSGPAMIGAVDYGLASIEFCIDEVNAGAYVTRVEVLGTPPYRYVAIDDTDRTADGCYTLTVNASGDEAYDMTMFFDGGGTLRVSGIQSTWAPAAGLPVAAPLATSDAVGTGG